MNSALRPLGVPMLPSIARLPCHVSLLPADIDTSQGDPNHHVLQSAWCLLAATDVVWHRVLLSPHDATSVQQLSDASPSHPASLLQLTLTSDGLSTSALPVDATPQDRKAVRSALKFVLSQQVCVCEQLLYPTYTLKLYSGHCLAVHGVSHITELSGTKAL